LRCLFVAWLHVAIQTFFRIHFEIELLILQCRLLKCR
jgi:hypothetical protein